MRMALEGHGQRQPTVISAIDLLRRRRLRPLPRARPSALGYQDDRFDRKSLVGNASSTMAALFDSVACDERQVEEAAAEAPVDGLQLAEVWAWLVVVGPLREALFDPTRREALPLLQEARPWLKAVAGDASNQATLSVATDRTLESPCSSA